MKNEIKNLRLRIDGLAQLTQNLNPILIKTPTQLKNVDSKELQKATDALFLGKAWFGKCLGAIGTSSPYPKDGSRKTVADIEPTADKENKVVRIIHVGDTIQAVDRTNETWKRDEFIEANHIEKVDWLRQQISEVIDQGVEEIEKAPDREEYMELPLMWYYMEAKTKLMTARFWLGFELERIKKEDG